MENRKPIETSNNIKIYLFELINKIGKSLVGLMKKKRTQIKYTMKEDVSVTILQN